MGILPSHLHSNPSLGQLWLLRKGLRLGLLTGSLAYLPGPQPEATLFPSASPHGSMALGSRMGFTVVKFPLYCQLGKTIFSCVQRENTDVHTVALNDQSPVLGR